MYIYIYQQNFAMFSVSQNEKKIWLAFFAKCKIKICMHQKIRNILRNTVYFTSFVISLNTIFCQKMEAVVLPTYS
jgi:hypothetical protein